MAKATNKKDDPRDPATKRLDGILRLVIEALKSSDSKTFNDSSISRILNSTGLTPTEIAKVLGKESATAIAPYLYQKKK
ncbi:MAG: hypothetical protein H6580_05540 [Flammeovirgaceae bacterium]|nr:hypothetical protein [Flammeovirgaceae bacterium]